MATATFTGSRTVPAARTARTAPPAGTWAIDPARARVAFAGKAGFLAPTISARFPDVEGRVVVGTGRTGHRLRVEVDVTTMTTGTGAYDDVIGAVDPFDAARFPLAVYESTRVTWTAHGADVEGRLTLRGVTVPVALAASYDVGRTGDRMVVRAGGTVDRQAFGLRFDVHGVGRLVPRQLRLDIDVDVVRAG
jgi:polyisoprenoid-binding protein YceI